MNEKSFVVVFPSVFSKNKIPQLISNIKKILKAQRQQFKSVKRDGDVILVDASDPVFASSAISLLFGIKKIIIARQVRNDFDVLVREITSLGGNLLLKGDKFLVKVEGKSKGFLPKDIEIAATSSIIEKKSKLGAHPGTDEDFNKMLFTYLTKSNAYIAIFVDEGLGGVPYDIQDQNAICCIYDEFSAVSCLETIKQGFATKVIVCYKQKSELMNLAKIINKIIPRLLQEKVNLEFFMVPSKGGGSAGYLSTISQVTEVLLSIAKKDKIEHVSLAISPLVFPGKIIDYLCTRVIKEKKLPIMPLYGSDSRIFDNLKEIGLGNKINSLESLVSQNFKEMPKIPKDAIAKCLKTRKVVSVKIGPNNVHDILDSFE